MVITMLSEQHGLESLLEIAQDLTASLAAEDRYGRLLTAVRKFVPYDAACLMRREGDALVPVAGHGLLASALVRRYDRREHPRLDAVLRAAEPLRFAPDSTLPDPFEGALEADPAALTHIHACLGCPLYEGATVVGVLTADALAPGAFDELNPRLLAMLGALAGAAMRTTALIEGLERRADHRRRVAQDLQRSAAEQTGGQLIGTSPALRRLREEIALVAASDLAVLITGETGVGKELVARHIHEESNRRDEALIQVNCAALPVTIAESELFGHVAGAFTGATRDRAGKFEVANGGTLFLDEIGELPLELQPKLLRVLQQGEIQRVGSDRAHRVDVRIIAATNRSLPREVERGRFRADVYHRLAVFPLRVPPLCERREDITVLAAHFTDAAARRLGMNRVRLSEDARLALVEADWPGNVRELENVVSRGVLRASFGIDPDATVVVGAGHLGFGRESAGGPAMARPAAAGSGGDSPTPVAGPIPLRRQLDQFQRRVVLDAVDRHAGNWAAAARELGLHRGNLHHLARRLGLR
jgi:anaerobic nitric oxide reductase transcription regulator